MFGRLGLGVLLVAGLTIGGCQPRRGTVDPPELGDPVLRINVNTDDIRSNPTIDRYLANRPSPSVDEQIRAGCLNGRLWRGDVSLNNTVLAGDFGAIGALGDFVLSGALTQRDAREIAALLLSGNDVDTAVSALPPSDLRARIIAAIQHGTDSNRFVTFAAAVATTRAEVFVVLDFPNGKSFPGFSGTVTAKGIDGTTVRDVDDDDCDRIYPDPE